MSHRAPQPQMPQSRQVYVSQGGTLFHASLNCDDLRRCQEEGVSWCSAREAHLSRLQPCSCCTAELLAQLKVVVGSPTSGEKRSRGLPNLRTLIAASMHSDGTSEHEAQGAPYGAAEDLDDPRFNNASALGWGTHTYGQDPQEYLGNPTEDDNDWRGMGRTSR